MQANAAPIRPLQKGHIVFRGQTAALKPAMNRDGVKFWVSQERILVHRAARRPAGENGDDLVICCHDRHFMTTSVISQRATLVIDANLVTAP